LSGLRIAKSFGKEEHLNMRLPAAPGELRGSWGGPGRALGCGCAAMGQPGLKIPAH